MIAILLIISNAQCTAGASDVIIIIQIPTEDGFVGYPIPVCKVGVAGVREAAVDSYAVFHHKRNAAVVAGGRLVGACCHPDLFDITSIYHCLQITGSIYPGSAVTCAACFDVADRHSRDHFALRPVRTIAAESEVMEYAGVGTACTIGKGVDAGVVAISSAVVECIMD